MADIFGKRKVVIYEISDDVSMNIGTMPNVTIGSMPNVVVASGSITATVASGAITVSSGNIIVDSGAVNVSSKYNMAKFGAITITTDGATTEGAIVSMFDDDITTYYKIGNNGTGATTQIVKWDLGASTATKTVVVYMSVENNGTPGQTTTLEGSANDSDWDVIDTSTVGGAVSPGVYDNLIGTNQTYRYFRIKMVQTATKGPHRWYLYDVQLII